MSLMRASLGSSKRHSASSSVLVPPSPPSAYEDASLSRNFRNFNSNLNGEPRTRVGDAVDAEREAGAETDTATVHGSSTANSSPNPSWDVKTRPPSTPPAQHAAPSTSQPPSSASSPPSPPPQPAPFAHAFWDPASSRARIAYFRAYSVGAVCITVIILAVLGVFWGTLFKLPARPLKGVVLDFDGGPIAQTLTQSIRSFESSLTTRPVVAWTYVPLATSQSRYPAGLADVRSAIERQDLWVAVAVAPGASALLQAAVQTPNSSYDGSGAVTAFASEGRNENAYRTYLFPHLTNMLTSFQRTFAHEFATQQSANLSADNLQLLFKTAPQTLTLPAGFTVTNVLPFFQPIATAPVFTGLIFVLILAFFTVLVANGARAGSGLNRLLTLRSLIALRFFSAAGIYLFFSLLYSFVNLMFGVRMDHTFGHAGFVLFWLGTWIYMLGVGLVLESWVVVLKQNAPFFFFPWLVVNLSVGIYPLEMLPKVYHYGYGSPYYNITRIVRTLVFGTRNSLGLNYGVLLAWVLIGTLNMSVVQWYLRRQDIMALRKASASKAASSPPSSDADAEKAQIQINPGMAAA